MLMAKCKGLILLRGVVSRNYAGAPKIRRVEGVRWG